MKIHSGRLRKNKWNLSLTLEEARRNDEIVALAESQVLRWIDEINGVSNVSDKVAEIRREIRRIKKEDNSPQNKRTIRDLYNELDSYQYSSDYMCLVIDKEKDYYRACRGFSINGVQYKRLLGTNGGIKNSTIVFVSESVVDEIRKRIENGRDDSKEIVTAKLEAYKALTCSASVPVSMPNGILVVDDVMTEFDEDIIYLTDEGDGEPVMELKRGEHIIQDSSDGYGIMMPSLAKRWSEELGLDYMMSGCNTRFSFEKGMVFTFDFVDFAEKVAGSYIVKDAWGYDVDVRDVELVLTTSMVKLWDSYGSCDEYIRKSISNKYTFGIPKFCPETLESERYLNYQFIQSHELSNEDIEELIAPTMNEIEDVLHGDWRKAVLFLKGSGLTENNVDRLPDDYIKALMICDSVINDPFVGNNIYQMIRNKINEAKVGVLKVHGNFSVLSGDPYLLCQSIFGLEKTGLLKAGEIYNKYWSDIDAVELLCYRAPMTCHNNIRRVYPSSSPEAKYWYQYMQTCTIFNGWDTASSALNGADFDGDLVLLTDNEVLLRTHKKLPTLMCVQRKADKRISTEEDFIRSNIDSFGNDIGQTTNWITSMFEVQSSFRHSSEEYKTLEYRIMCGQQYQQNAIDKAKGIISKPMPREWHDFRSVNKIEDPDKKSLYRSIVADKKPYFMRYIYPALMRDYNKYINNTNRNALREFQITVDEMLSMPMKDLTERQKEFLIHYHNRMPVGNSDCVMNIICRKFEERFSNYISRRNSTTEFDYTILKSDVPYTSRQFYDVKKLYDDYNKRLANYSIFVGYERVNEWDSHMNLSIMDAEFRKQCEEVCPNSKALCNIVLDICYKRNSTKRFAWDMCGEEIIDNLLRNNGGVIYYPTLSDEGDICFGGNRFIIKSKQLEVDD